MILIDMEEGDLQMEISAKFKKSVQYILLPFVEHFAYGSVRLR